VKKLAYAHLTLRSFFVNINLSFFSLAYMKRLKIIFSSYDDLKNPRYAGGGARAIHEVARRLAVSHEVTVVTGRYPGARDETVDGVRYERVGWFAGSPKLGQAAFHFALARQVRNQDFDVWFESFTPPFSTSCLQLFTRRPVVGLVHMLSGEDMQRKYRLPFHRLERAGLQTYRHCIVLTKESGERIRRVNPSVSVEVIPNGIERPKDSDAIGDKKRHVLFLGRIEVNQKGLDILVRAYARVSESIGYPLAIAGAGTEGDERTLRTLVAEYGLGDRVEFLGKVDGEKKIEVLRQAACLAIPSRFETFSLSALEAMAFDVPVVAFALPSLQWMPSEAVVKIEPFDEPAFAKALCVAVRGDKASGVGGKALGDAFWNQYDWDAIARRYEQYLEKVVGEKSIYLSR
jgi:phosphatidylinositol alpha-mannosyltransferase